MDGRKAVRWLDGHFLDSVTGLSELIRLNWRAAPPCFSVTFICFSPKASVIADKVRCRSRRCSEWVIGTVGCLGVLCTLSLSVYLTTTALLSRPLAPGLYLLLSLTVMKPAFKEQGAGSEASQIRSVERLAGWAWWMRARMSFCRGCIVKSFHCHRRAYEGLMNEGASVRNALPPLPLLPLHYLPKLPGCVTFYPGLSDHPKAWSQQYR